MTLNHEIFHLKAPIFDCVTIYCILQKEVKSRIQYIVDVLGKMDTALQQPVIPDKVRTRSPSPKETRRVRKASTDR